MSFFVPKKDSRIRHFKRYELKHEHDKDDKFLEISKKAENEVGDGAAEDSTKKENVQNDAKLTSKNNLSILSSSILRFYPRRCKCCRCEESHHREDENLTCCKGFIDSLSCPPWGTLSRFLLLFLLGGCIFFWMWSMMRDVATDTISAVIILELVGLPLGQLAKCIRLPPLLGPLLLGIVLRNIPGLNFYGGLTNRHWIEPIREMALTIILTRAGLELSPKQLKKLGIMVPLAAFGPCCIEASVCAALFYAFFHQQNVPVVMCFAAGFAISAVSPAVVIPGMLFLKKKGFGHNSGVDTLLIAASSIDDVLAISAFSVCLSLLVSDANLSNAKDEISWKVKLSWLGIPVGILHGLIVGMLLHFLPSKDSGQILAHLRLLTILVVNFCSTFLYDVPQLSWLSGAGSLAVLVTSFVASFGWRSVPHWKKDMHSIEKKLGYIWVFCVPLLFGTIGREMDFLSIAKHWDTFGEILVIILICLFIRCLFMFTITAVAKFNKKERLFCALSWIPKATVQCALAPLVVSRLQDSKDEQLKMHAGNIVIMAVTAVLITAPLGAILINLTGPKLLKRNRQTSEGNEISGDDNSTQNSPTPQVVDDVMKETKVDTLYKQPDDEMLMPTSSGIENSNVTTTATENEQGPVIKNVSDVEDKRNDERQQQHNVTRVQQRTGGSLADVIRDSLQPRQA